MTLVRSVPQSERALKRVLGAILLSGVCVLAPASSLLANSGGSNGSIGAVGAQTRRLSEREINERIGSFVAKAPPAVGCAVLGSNGEQVTQVVAMSFGDLAYWLQYRSSGQLATTVVFKTTPLFEGSPDLGETRRFNTDFSNVVTTPFGVPAWGLDKTSGPWALIVKDNLGRAAMCRFEVVPQ